MRTKRGFVRRRRTKRILKAARGYRGSRSKLMRVSRETLRRAWWYGRRGRRQKKGNFRRLWIVRITAASSMRGMNYSRFIAGLKGASIELNRKVLADLALTDEQTFDRLVQMAQESR